jgi:hypothetical protein
VACNVANYGAALLTEPDAANLDLGTMLEELLSRPIFAERARAFSKKYAQFDQKVQIDSMVGRCEEILRAH